MTRLFYVLALWGSLSLAAGCSKKEPELPALDPKTQKQMDLLLEAIATVQSNYVDESKVATRHIIASTIQGMMAPVDPYARVISAPDPGNPPPPVTIYQAESDAVVSMKIPVFDEKARRSLRKLESQIRRARAAGILIDLRGSTGHDYESALVVLNWFLPPGSVAGTWSRNHATAEVVNTRRKALVKPDIGLVVLVDENTEDAAEWVAAALKYHQRALLIGRPTRGLGLIRNAVPVTDEWRILMTAGHVKTPDGTSMTGAPVIPDIEVHPSAGSESIYRTGLKQLAAGSE